jgi:Zinc finger, C3HC4 type (RING finger)/TRAF-type zinc finger
MTERPLQSVYDDEVASVRPARSNSNQSSLPGHASRSSSDEVSIPKRSMQPSIADLDLRELEYLELDSHLSCPVCHIPFVDPVYVDCGHYFCAECLAIYWQTARQIGNRKPCPACRSPVRSSRWAPRLIVNMCNDVRVNCPLKDCGQTMARSTLESHMASYCSEQLIECPGPGCKENTKRKHFLQDQCRHTTHVECACGDLVLRENLEVHKEVQCPVKNLDCLYCSHSVDFPDHESHLCDHEKPCPGKDLGCEALLDRLPLEEHIKSCSMAKMAPHFEAFVANNIAPLQHELVRSQERVRYLEEGIDRMHESINARTRDSKKPYHEDTALDVTLGAASDSNSLLTPSAPSSATSSSNTPISTVESAEHRHLLALHEDLRHTVTELGLNITQLSRTVDEVDARNSMLTINETLRLKEELTLTNNGLYGTRTQVQWLLNRERAGQQPGARGRATAPSVTHPQTPSIVGAAAGTNGTGAITSSGLNGHTMRPARRTSGGSQERVKL